MGNFSRDTFDRLKHYVAVRLQQGVPIVDADWNEMQDIRKFELEAFLKWFVGNGVPVENAGFAIGSVDGDNDFSIADGHCLIEGWDAVNDWAEQGGEDPVLTYTSQILFGNDDLADMWGVDPLPSLTTPDPDARTDVVYLDVWEREVDSSDIPNVGDPDIKNDLIPTETCIRTKREWVVRVAENVEVIDSVPQIVYPDLTGHVFYPLAMLERKAAVAVIEAGDITDLRRRVNPAYQDVEQVATDAYGTDYTLDGDGRPNLKTSLRDAINAILAGRPPTTAVQRLYSNIKDQGRISAFQHSDNTIWVFWETEADESNNNNILYKNYYTTGELWTEEQPVTTVLARHLEPLAFEDQGGNVWVFWYSEGKVYCRRHEVPGSWGEVETVATGGSPFWVLEDNVGTMWLFFLSSGQISYKKHDPSAGTTWEEEQPEPLADGGSLSSRDLHAIEHSSGGIFLFWKRDALIYYLHHNENGWSTELPLTSESATGSSDASPQAVEDHQGDIIVFFRRQDYHPPDPEDRSMRIWQKRIPRAFSDLPPETQVTTDPLGTDHSFHYAIRDVNGRVWLFYSANGLYYKCYTEGSDWGPSIDLSPGDIGYFRPMAFTEQNGNIWVLFDSNYPDGLSLRLLIFKI